MTWSFRWFATAVSDARADQGLCSSAAVAAHRPNVAQLPASSVSVTRVVNVENKHDLLVIIDAVPDPVLTPARTVLSLKGRTKWRPDAPRIVCQRPEDELNTCRGHRFG